MLEAWLRSRQTNQAKQFHGRFIVGEKRAKVTAKEKGGRGREERSEGSSFYLDSDVATGKGAGVSQVDSGNKVVVALAIGVQVAVA